MHPPCLRAWDLLPYVVDLMLEVADLNLKVPDLRFGEIRLTLAPAINTYLFLNNCGSIYKTERDYIFITTEPRAAAADGQTKQDDQS